MAASSIAQPSLLLIGAQKAATTSIFDLLEGSGMGLCGVTSGRLYNAEKGSTKESHFWDQSESDFPYTGHASLYSSQYVNSSCSYFMDATPNYLFDALVPARMVGYMPASWVAGVRMVAVVREPIGRDLSMYNMMKNEWRKAGRHTSTVKLGAISDVMCEAGSAANGSFPTYSMATSCKTADWNTTCLGHSTNLLVAYEYCANYLAATSEQVMARTGYVANPSGGYPNRLVHGMYYPQLKEYATKFTRSQLLVLEFGALVSRQAYHVKAIVNFYGLPYSSHAAQLTELTAENTEQFPGKVAAPSCETRAEMEAVYAPYNAALLSYLKETQSTNAAPDLEPRFTGSVMFEPPSCTNVEKAEGGAEATNRRAARQNDRNTQANAMQPP